METFESIRTVLAVRKYQDKPIPKEVLRRIVEAGRLTGSASNKQPWNFIVIEDKKVLSELGALAKTGPYVAQAPAAIVVVIEKNPLAVSDGSRAIQSMILAAWAEGIGSNWVGFIGMDNIKPLLDIPDNLDVLAILPLGFPADKIGKGKKKRKPLAEVAHAGKFGKTY